MTGAALVTALAAIAVGTVLAAARRSFTAGLAAQAAGAALLAVAGFAELWSRSRTGAAFTSSFTARFGSDPLSGFFLAMLGLVAAPSIVFSGGYLGREAKHRATAVLTGLFVLALAGVLCARDPITFLAGWELMTMLPAAVILVSRGADRVARRTVFTYLAITHLGGAGTWIAVLLLAKSHAFGGGELLARGSHLQVAIAVAALVGIGTKAGVMPLHVWLPRAHPIAPAPVSALMSGVMVKVAIYALVRVLVEWCGPLPLAVGLVVLALGALSAVLGILYALFQGDLKRLLALSTIENVGIVVTGIGACLVLRSHGADTWAGIALAAALLHALNHAVFKAVLFLGAGAVEKAAGTLDLDRLGGLLRRMPWTGGALLVGVLAVGGLPPLNGFASEWLSLQALLHLTLLGHPTDGIVAAIALGLLALTAGLALFCFVKVAGLVLLGRPRTDAAAAAVDGPLPIRAALAVLAGACVMLGLLPGLVVHALTRLEPWSTPLGRSATLHVPGTGSLPSPWIALVLVAATGGLVLLRGRRRAAPAPTWACGQLVEPALDWTSAGFTKPVRLVLDALLRPERDVAVETSGAVLQSVTYTGRVPHLLDERVYRPAVHASLRAARHARRLQSGNLGTYAGYLIALVVVVLAAARIGLIG